MGLESDLKKETEKWLNKIEREMKTLKLLDENKKDLIKNIQAYTEDCRYFLEKKDFIRSFESVVWSWAWLTILRELGVLK